MGRKRKHCNETVEKALKRSREEDDAIGSDNIEDNIEESDSQSNVANEDSQQGN